MNNLLKLKKYKIFDNILSLEHQNVIEQLLLSQQFSWYFSENTSKLDDNFEYHHYLNKNVKEYFQFTHVFFNCDLENLSSTKNSNHADIILNILDIFKVKNDLNYIKILRVKANLQTYNKNSSENNYTAPHHDFHNLKHYVLLYYVNDSDGDTFLFDEKLNIIERITPKKGRFLLFDGDVLHASSTPINTDKRVIINFNLLDNNE